ncbi:MAG: helix-turn-helix domain-containing protein [Planctomycetes bacterium]|jgi:excisionase family DNA binding protein|nr:helix-turn-helix domain-containing protein [Planctomycetota bacterium]
MVAMNPVSALLTVEEVSMMLNCSIRHVYRLADGGRMPRPVKLGNLNRWSKKDLQSWIDDGCPTCRRRRPG